MTIGRFLKLALNKQQKCLSFHSLKGAAKQFKYLKMSRGIDATETFKGGKEVEWCVPEESARLKALLYQGASGKRMDGRLSTSLIQ